MDTKWTPGPWARMGKAVFTLNNEDVNRMYAFVEAGWGDDGKRISEDEQDANARLIAAAPDLYEALQACIDYGSMTGAKWVAEKASAALAKARGE